ncbi:MAG: PQQ-dependent sugar dehydrogenase [Acidobacteria bacterium]|nr:PQQ-dependent sugar dehydrogenase [Acidobacteriota bacterium]
MEPAMHLARALGLATTIVIVGTFPADAQEALPDPIAEPIRKGDLVVEATEFVRAPRTEESALDAITNLAYARIQYMTPIGDGSGRLVLNDLRGVLYLTDENGMAPVTYMDIRTLDVGFDDSMFPNETGIVGVAFHPQFADAGTAGFGKFYTAYSATSDSGHADYLDDDAESHESVIREWTTDDPAANVFSGTSREVFRIGQFASNHNVGAIAFNPTAAPGSPDYGILYATFGDAGAANDPRDYGQSLSDPHGAIIRIDPLAGDGDRGYGIPPDNPFVGEAGVAPEIWAYGLRHAQYFSWDTDGRMFMGDIGQNFVEEVNLGIPGANYGWRLREGAFATAFAVGERRPGRVYPRPAEDDQAFVYPVAQYDHGEGNAVGGGYVYRGQAIPELQGKYVFTDFPRGRVFYIDADNLESGQLAEIQELRLVLNGQEQDLVNVAGFPNTYGQGDRVDARLGIDSAGELYLLTKGDGWVRKLVPVR